MFAIRISYNTIGLTTVFWLETTPDNLVRDS